MSLIFQIGQGLPEHILVYGGLQKTHGITEENSLCIQIKTRCIFLNAVDQNMRELMLTVLGKKIRLKSSWQFQFCRNKR